MSKATKKSLLYALAALALIVFAMWLRYASRLFLHAPAVNYLRSGIYVCLFSAWFYAIWVRIIQVQVRRYLLAISALMVLWILLRSVKFSISNTDAERRLWYFYYFPMLLIPMLSVFVSQSLGKTEDFRLPRWTKLLYLPTLLLLLICTSRCFPFHPAFYRTRRIGMRAAISSCWAGRLCARGLRLLQW